MIAALVPLLLTARLAAQQDTSRRISFTCRAERAVRLLPKLGQVAGIHLEASPEAADEVLVVSAKDVPLAELMAKIAKVTACEWKPLSDGYRLQPSPLLRDREDAEETAYYAARCAKQLDEEIAEDRKNGALPDLAFHRLLRSLDLGKIAVLFPGDRVVFSTRPNPMQLPFPVDVSGFLQQIVDSHNQEVAVRPAATTDQGATADLASEPNWQPFRIDQVAKALVVATAELGGPKLSLILCDAYGRIDNEREETFSPLSKAFQSANGNFGGYSTSATDSAPPASKPRPSIPMIRSSAESDEFGRTISALSQQPISWSGIDSRSVERVYTPDRVEPLSFFATDCVFGLAANRHLPVVALLPDWAASFYGPGTSDLTDQDLLGSLELFDVARLMPDPSWLLVRPAHPAHSRSTRIDRAALAALLAKGRSGYPVALDEIAAFALATPPPEDDYFGRFLEKDLVPGLAENALTNESWYTLRLYAALETSERTALEAGRRIYFGSLSNLQAAQVRAMAFNVPGALETASPNPSSPHDLDTAHALEPTEALPNGLPGDGYFEMTKTADLFAAAVAPTGSLSPGRGTYLTPEELAWNRVSQTWAGNDPNIYTPAKVRIGQRTTYHFTFRVAPGFTMHSEICDFELPRDASTVAFAAMPPEFQKLIDARFAEIAKTELGKAMLQEADGDTIHP